MAQIAILTDSTAYITKELCQRYLSMLFHWLSLGRSNLSRWIDLTHGILSPLITQSAYRRLPSSDQDFSISLKNWPSFRRNCGTVGISGIRAPSRPPVCCDRIYKIPVQIIDTHATAGGLALIYWLRPAPESGLQPAETARLPSCGQQIEHIFMVDTLNIYTRRPDGGATRFLGSALSIKADLNS